MKQLFILALMLITFNMSAQCPTANCNSQNSFVITSQSQLNSNNNEINNSKPLCFINNNLTEPITINSGVNFPSENNTQFLSFQNNSNIVCSIIPPVNIQNNRSLYSVGNTHFGHISLAHQAKIYVTGHMVVSEFESNNNSNNTNYIYLSPNSSFTFNGNTYTSNATFNASNGGSGSLVTVTFCSTALPIDIEYFTLKDDVLSWKIISKHDRAELQFSVDGKAYKTIANVTNLNTYNVKESGMYRLKVSSIGENDEYSSILKFKSKKDMSYILYDFNTGQRIKEPTDRYIIKYEDGTVKKIFKL